jgi:hypothetical protein
MEWAVELATKVLRQKSTVVYLTDMTLLQLRAR